MIMWCWPKVIRLDAMICWTSVCSQAKGPGWQMVKKKLVILANSIKRNARCVAGREVTAKDGRYSVGPWIRPISIHGEGELDCAETTCSDGSHIELMQFAEIALAAAVNDIYQPENWTIAGPRCWRKLDWPYGPVDHKLLLESPADLWFDRAEKRTDRISHERLKTNPPAQSLYVIRPEDLHLRFYKEYNSFKERDERKSRGAFTYKGVKYDFTLRDPVASKKYCSEFPASGAPPKEVGFSKDNGPLVCVSVASDFKGFHYKILATVIE